MLTIKSGCPRLWCARFSRGKPALAVDIVPVRTKQQWRDFHHLPFRIYAGDPNWVPPLLLERQLHFTPKHNPFFQHAKAEFFLAYRAGDAPMDQHCCSCCLCGVAATTPSLRCR